MVREVIVLVSTVVTIVTVGNLKQGVVSGDESFQHYLAAF